MAKKKQKSCLKSLVCHNITKADSDSGGELTSPVTTFDYDEAGNLISTTDARNNTTQYEYDELDRRVKTIDANLEETAIAYDKNSNVVAIVDPLGNETTNRYDIVW